MLPRPPTYHGFCFYIESWLAWISQSAIHPVLYGSFTSNLNWKQFIEPVYAGATKTVTATHRSGGSGSPVIDTSTYEFGGASGKFVAANDQYLSTPDSNDWYFTGDFTIDVWAYFDSLPTNGNFMMFYCQYQNSSNRLCFGLYNNSRSYQLAVQLVSVGSYLLNQDGNTSPNLSTDSWHHFALVRSGNTWYLFEDGTQLSSVSNASSIPNYAGPVYIGSNNGGLYYMDGWLDEYRVSNVARWTSNFSVPTSEYAPDANTLLLLHMDGSNGSTMFTDSEAITPEYVALQSEYRMLQQQLNQTQARNKQLETTISEQSAMISQLNQQITSTIGTAQTYHAIAVVFVIIAVALAAFSIYQLRGKKKTQNTVETQTFGNY